jgi:hypothetical protein
MGSYAKKLLDIYDDWERRVREQSEERGEQKGIRESIETCYRTRFGDVPADLHAVIAAMTDVATLRRWMNLCVTAPAEHIADAMLSARQPR